MRRAVWRFLRSVGAFLLADGFGVIGAVVFSIVLARLRGAEELGLFSFSMAQALLLQLLIEANFAITLPQEVARCRKVFEPLRRAQVAKWYLSLAALPLAGVLLLLAGRADAVMPTLVACAVTLGHSFVASYTAVLHGLGQMTLLGVIIAVSSTVGALAGVAALVLGWSLPVVILVQGVGTALPAWLWLGWVLRRWEPGWSPWQSFLGELWHQVRTDGVGGTFRRMWRILHERWYWIVLGFLTIGYMRFGVLFLGWVGAAAAAIGAYSAAQRFLVVLRMVPNAFFRVLLPSYATHPERFSLPWAVASSAVIGGSIAGIIHLSAPWLLQWTFRIPEAVPMLQLMGWAMPGVVLSHLLEAYVLTLPRAQRVVVLWTGIVLGIGFLAAFVLFPYGGEQGIAALYVVLESLYAVGLLLWVVVRHRAGEIQQSMLWETHGAGR